MNESNVTAKLRESILNQRKHLWPDNYTFRGAGMECQFESTQHAKIHKNVKTVEVVQPDQKQDQKKFQYLRKWHNLTWENIVSHKHMFLTTPALMKSPSETTNRTSLLDPQSSIFLSTKATQKGKHIVRAKTGASTFTLSNVTTP